MCVSGSIYSSARAPFLPNWSHVCLRSQVFLINLARRSDRRERMLSALTELEIDPLVVNAVDGR